MGVFLRDLKYALRMLLKHPTLSVTAVAAMAMGIGFTTIIFSIVHGALMRGLPYEDGDRIVHVQRTHLSEGVTSMDVSIHDYLDWREQQSSFEQLAAYRTGTVNFRGTERPVRYDGGFVSWNAFSVLGVQPVIGRNFREGEDRPGAPLVTILAYHVWQDGFDGSRDVLGQIVNLNGEAAEIVGVMPEGFRFPIEEEIWTPLRDDPLATERNAGFWVNVFGKTRDGISLDQASVEFSGIAQRLAQEYPETNEGIGTVIEPFTKEYIGDDVSGLLYAMLAIVMMVLFIACLNVANLLLARAALRVKEMGIRTALGAHRWRIASQMIGEAMALAIAGAVFGVGIAWVGIRAFSEAVTASNPPYWLIFDINPTVLLFVVSITLAAALFSGLLPAIKATAGDVTGILKDDSRGSSSLRIGRTSKVLVIGEIALSLALLVSAGLMTKSIVNLRTYDYGFESDNVFTARVGLFENEFPDTLSRIQFFEQVQERIAGLPGVTSTAMSTGLPGTGVGSSNVAIEGEQYIEDRDYPRVRVNTITPGYFETFGVEIQNGRDFQASDNAEALSVAVVNQSFVRTYMDGDAVGGRFQFGNSERRGDWLTIVGVVPDMFMEGIGNPDGRPEGVYIPLSQSDARFVSISAKGPANAMTLTPDVRDVVTQVHADTPLYWVSSMDERLEQATWFYNVFGVLFLVFGISALIMAAVGLYGVMAFNVSTRTTEMGIRMAIGAQGKEVLKMVMRQGLVQIVVGIVIGLALAVLAAGQLQMIMFEVDNKDPSVYALIIGLLIMTGLLASFIPARRATRVDPMVALRRD